MTCDACGRPQNFPQLDPGVLKFCNNNCKTHDLERRDEGQQAVYVIYDWPSQEVIDRRYANRPRGRL